MSAKQMGQVYDRELPAGERDVLLALADHADHEGAHAWCTAGRIAWKLGISPRTVYVRLARLEKLGVLVRTGDHSESGAVIYSIHLAKLPLKAPYSGKRTTRSLRAGEPVKGANPAPGAKAAPPGAKLPGVGAKKRGVGATHAADKPSIFKPSTEPAAEEREALSWLAAAGGYLDFRKTDLRSEWRLALAGVSDTEALAILRDERLPNGKPIRFPSGFCAARDRRAAARRDAVQAKRAQKALDAIGASDRAVRAKADEFLRVSLRAGIDHPWWQRVIDQVIAEQPDADAKRTTATWLANIYPVASSVTAAIATVSIAVKDPASSRIITDRYATALHHAVSQHFSRPARIVTRLHEQII